MVNDEKSQPSHKASAGKSKTAQREEEILKFWKENQIFEKTLKQTEGKKEYVFYEGPPTANGKPGIHHLEARAFKDLVPRYKTMRGYHVRRKGGWDTHGLPVELQVEKQLGLKSKKEIEKYGIAGFNKKCKESVWEYVDLWEKFTDRIGYWVDLKNPYITYKNEYIESVWNVLKEINKKKLLYKDYKVVPWCPRCGTALSSHELAQGYQDDKDLSVYAKFKIKGFPNAYFLAWTTTPWTLPGNVALAVGENIEYVEAKVGEEILVLAKERLSVLEGGYEIIATHKGKEMVGMEYEPLYGFLKNNFEQKDKEAFGKAYKIYAADFVNTEDGTGIVHTAVMYGQDDFVLGTKIGLPKYHLVDDAGHFIKETEFLSLKFVKDEETAVEIIKDLAHRNLLFKKEKYEHSYPHCWRCKTPLIYYARDSWYIRMSDLRDKLVKENEDINWEPSYIKDGRFGEWLKDIKDWAISRERYWGTPLPIWQDKEGKVEIIGSIEEFKEKTKKGGNSYYTLRHGEAEQNIKDIINSDPKNVFHLTENGRKQVEEVSKKIKAKNINLIITSPFARCTETAEIVAEKIGLQKENIVVDERLWEFKKGPDFEGKEWGEYWNLFNNMRERFEKAPGGGENLFDLNKRAGDFIYDIEKKYSGKNILIVSHHGPIDAMNMVAMGADLDKLIELKEKGTFNSGFADFKELKFIPIPHNENYELDLHKPYIDEVELVDEKGASLTRVKEVMDVWFDSGAMPFAQDHYPFDFAQGKPFNEKILYPADFISEAIDQTRGWFYTLHAIGVLMGKGKAYKNVICLGHILDAEGKKMSKSLGNIVDPWLMIDKYGVDALRLWMYGVNQPGDSKNFDERTVDEIVKKVFNILSNIFSFYSLHADKNIKPSNSSENVLDKWIVSKLEELLGEGTKYLEDYKIFEASRLIRDFSNDFSTWYIRRSRDRFKSENEEDRQNALSTTLFVLKELMKYMAPFTPFFAEDLYQNLKSESEPESVHLCEWPEAGKIEEEILESMEEARRVVSLALEKRNSAGIKVRQPLLKLKIKNSKLKDLEEYQSLVKDEVNVKEIIFDQNLEDEVELNTELNQDLINEGNVREFVRAIQSLRKEKGLVASEAVSLKVETNKEGKEFLEANAEQIKKPTNVNEFVFENNDGAELKIENPPWAGETGWKLKIKIA